MGERYHINRFEGLIQLNGQFQQIDLSIQYNSCEYHNGNFGRNRKVIFNMVIENSVDRKIILGRKDQS